MILSDLINYCLRIKVNNGLKFRNRSFRNRYSGPASELRPLLIFGVFFSGRVLCVELLTLIVVVWGVDCKLLYLP